MTITTPAPTEAATDTITAPADTTPDVVLSDAEKDKIVHVTAANEETPVVPGAREGERRAWSRPQPSRAMTRD